MSDQREAVFEALLSASAYVSWGPRGQTLKLRSRRLKTIDQVSADDKPCLFQIEPTESATKRRRMPELRRWAARWVVYHAAGADPDATPATENNLILNAIEAALEPGPTDPGFPDGRNTLQGLVHDCWIEGEIFKDPGDLDGWGLLVVPIVLLVP